VASDGTVLLAGIDADDTVTLTFSENTNQPAVAPGNIDTLMALSGAHSWLDGGGAFTSAVWSSASVLVVMMQAVTSPPTITVGDSITLGAAVTDGAGNPAATVAFSALSGSFSMPDVTPPAITAVITRDTNGDGFIDRLEVTFSEPVSWASVVAGRWHVSSGTISGVQDNGAPNDPVIWVNLADGVLDTGALPALTADAGALKDLAGNDNTPQSMTPSDGAPPVLLVSLAVVGERTVALKFSEPVSGGTGAPLAVGDFTCSGATISYLTPIDLSGNRSREVFLSLASPLTSGDVILPQMVSVPAGIRDAAGSLVVPAAHRVSDLYLGLVNPVWASDGGTGPAMKDFTGSGRLGDRDITLQAFNGSGSAALLRYDVNVPAGGKTNGLWLPQWKGGLVSTADTGAKSLGAAAVAGSLYNYLVPGTDVKSGDRFEFLFEIGGIYAARVINGKDPRTVAPWTFTVQDVVRQRGGVTIMNNVISPRFGDVTTIAYSVHERGSVTILVSDMQGNIVNVLQNGVQGPGDWSATWNGRNRGGRAVAPGLYFVKITGPGFDEVRKVIVTN
jgi:hypothetical protein